MGIVETIAIAMGAAWASGINLYATLAMLGILGATGSIVLPPDLMVLTNPLVIAAAGFMYIVEFFADKTPGVDTGWDAIHTFIRIPAGAVLAAGAVGDVSAGAELAALIAGGALAGTSHAMKAGTRIVINASPEPFTNWGASLAEDAAVIAGLWAALHYPWVFLGLLAAFIVLAIWLLPRLWRAIRWLFARLRQLLGGPPAGPRETTILRPPRRGSPAEPALDGPGADAPYS
jgi:hypothetical protein